MPEEWRRRNVATVGGPSGPGRFTSSPEIAASLSTAADAPTAAASSSCDEALVRAKTATLSIFYGYSPEVIARWCGVSIATARRWKHNGKAPRPALRLFGLYRDARVLDEHWEGWRAVKGALTDPAGSTTTQRQLAAYALIMQWAASLASQDPATHAEFFELPKRA